MLTSPLWAAAWLALSPTPSLAQASMVPLHISGPVSNRFNVVFLSEGYTGAEMAQFLNDATNAFHALLAHQPYLEYSNYFNAFAIKTNSVQSGSDHPNIGSSVNTYFNSSYDAYDVFITIPTNGTGQGRVDALLQTFVPACSLSVLLVNDPMHDGGSDGFDKTAIVATGYRLPEILTHESGHVVANLGDEYDSPYPGFPDTEEPNTTRQTNRSLVKWNYWIPGNVPVPTTPPDSYPDVPGLFEGAHYHSTGWYRPRLDCLMRNNYVPFCEVCSEALVLAIYQHVRPLESFSPASTNLSITTTQSVSLSIAPLQPTTHALAVQWFTNGVACAGATNTSFNLSPQLLPNGSNSVRVVVTDATTLVRYDPASLLSQSASWVLNVNLPQSQPQLHLDSPTCLTAPARFTFRVTGVAPQGFVIHSATNLSSWSPVITNSLVGGQYWFTSSAAPLPRQFFRAVTPP